MYFTSIGSFLNNLGKNAKFLGYFGTPKSSFLCEILN